MKHAIVTATFLALAACGPPRSTPIEEIIADIEPHYGNTIVIRTKLRSGARCHQEGAEWRTYCKDCQFCRGPLVVDTATTAGGADWPMILGGTWEYKDIRCLGPLNKVECYPFEVGATYVIRGFLERNRPPRLLVDKFWKIED